MAAKDRYVILLVSQWCATCPDAEALWKRLQAEYGFKYEVLDVAQPEGRMWAKKLMIRAVPSTIIDGKLAFVGVPDEAEARRYVES
ncbi:MAG: thioredoxin family protein [Aquificaceae bacterium]|nr:thioredoxin family protein [Aquificaceae bacterium]MCX8060393.1 thioredoxin family protein [Aquificaceae bacterium]MDW8097791.1 thioredoxin family protein [Aquificaceae bacterium]